MGVYRTYTHPYQIFLLFQIEKLSLITTVCVSHHYALLPAQKQLTITGSTSKERQELLHLMAGWQLFPACEQQHGPTFKWIP